MALLLFLLYRFDKKVLIRYFVILIGVLIFDFFTHPMWDSFRMGWWSYIYRDISLILSINLANLILFSVTLSEYFIKKGSDLTKFIISVVLMIPLVWLSEWLLITLGIRSYSQEVRQILPGLTLFKVPIGAFYYIPAYTALLIGFYKYWDWMIKNKPVVPVNKGHLLRNLIISTLAVFMFEIMVEPMVLNAGFPVWSYVYRDISLVLTGSWVIMVWVVTSLVDRIFIHFDLIRKFLAYIAFIAVITLPYEAYLITHDYRIYGPSTVANFSGFYIPYFNIPVEIFFAIPFYFALVISLIKYLQIVLNNKYSK